MLDFTLRHQPQINIDQVVELICLPLGGCHDGNLIASNGSEGMADMSRHHLSENISQD
jgi:hypothetical protein